MKLGVKGTFIALVSALVLVAIVLLEIGGRGQRFTASTVEPKAQVLTPNSTSGELVGVQEGLRSWISVYRSQSSTDSSHLQDRGTSLPPSPDSSGQQQWPEPMALSLGFWEQTANALKSLMEMQCWASSANVHKVLEPSIQATGASAFNFAADYKKGFKFRDLFDIANWNNISLQKKYSTIVLQQHFLEHATKETVFVQMIYVSWQKCQTIKAFASKWWFKYLQSHGFKITRTVCVNFHKAPSHSMSEKAFQELIFKDKGHNESVIFDLWEGVRGFKHERVALQKSSCDYCLSRMADARLSSSPVKNITYLPNSNSVYPVVPSQRILKALDAFLTQNLAGKDYIAIMLRTEKFRRDVLSVSPDKNPCVDRIRADWNSMKKSRNISKTLVLADVGSHGSKTWSSANAKRFTKHIESVVHSELTFDGVNAILEKITSSRNSVQIAVLNRQIVAHARCVVFVGGGAFQMQTASMYAHYHRGQECYSIRNSACDSRYISQVLGYGS